MSENANAAGGQPAAHATDSNNWPNRQEKYSTAELAAQRAYYSQLGYDVIPLKAGGKLPVAKGWQSKPPAEQWQRAPKAANIGIRAGGALRLAVLDLDEKNAAGTVAAGVAFLDGLGLTGKYPHVVTASGGAHVYFTLDGAAPGNVRLLAGTLAGELRTGNGSQTVAPPSVLSDGRGYRLVAGDFGHLPAVAYSDLLPLLGTATTTAEAPALAPIPGASIDKLLSTALTLATVGTRNITGFWLARGLRDNGAPKSQAAEVMREYAEAVPKSYDRDAYTEAEALDSLDSAYSRTGHANYGGQPALDELAAAYLWAESTTQPGRTWRTDKTVFVAHLQTAWRAGATVWDASAREVAEHTGTGTATAVRATNRLIDAGILHREATADRTTAASYRLGTVATKTFQSGSHMQLGTSEARNDTDSNNNKQLGAELARANAAAGTVATAATPGAPASTPTGTNCICDPLRDVTRSLDAFRFRALGPSAADVYDALATGPGTVAELAGRARMSKPTAWRALNTLQEYGLADATGRTWRRFDGDLDAIAASLGTLGKGEAQRQKHAEERRHWRKAVDLRLTAVRQPMPEAELANPARILAGRQTEAENMRKTAPPGTPVHDTTGKRIIGVVVGAVLQKRIQGSKHFGIQPPSIRLDAATVGEAAAAGAEYVQVTDTETGALYRALLSDFRARGLPVTVKGVKQLALPLLAWHTAQAEHYAPEQAPAETPAPLATQDTTSTSTPPPLAAASTATETAAGAPTETAATATQTPTPAHVAGIVHELAGRMSSPHWTAAEREQAEERRVRLAWPQPKWQRTEAEYADRIRLLQAQIAQAIAQEQAQAANAYA